MDLTNITLNDIIAYLTEVVVALGGLHLVLKKSLGIDVVERLSKFKLSKYITIKIKGTKTAREQLNLTPEKLKGHELFVELELQKHLLDRDFYTYGELDINKTRIFKIFVEEKMDSVVWSQTKMLDEYIAMLEKAKEKGEIISPDTLKNHILKSFINCDNSLECRLINRLDDIKVPDDRINLIISKFKETRAETMKNYIHRIERMFSPKANYFVSNEFLILSLFEVISFEIRGMIIDITEAFEDVNGTFMELELKKEL
jgi:hypothetical protein